MKSPPKADAMPRAWAVVNVFWPGPGTVAIYSAFSESEAKGKAARTLIDISGLPRQRIFSGFRTKRRPEFDGCHFPYGLSEDRAEEIVAEQRRQETLKELNAL